MKGATRDHLDERLVFNGFSGDLCKTFIHHGTTRMKFVHGISPSASASRASCSRWSTLLTDLVEKQRPIYSEIAISDQTEGKFQKSVTFWLAVRNWSTSPLCWVTREGQNICACAHVGTCTRRKHPLS